MNEWSSTNLLISIVLTWVIGLTPPLIIRHAVLKRPLDKWPAIGICVLFWFLEIALFSALGSQSKTHGATALMAIVSFWILRRNKDKSDRKQNLHATERPPLEKPLTSPFTEVQKYHETDNVLIKSSQVSNNKNSDNAKQYKPDIDKSKYYEQALGEIESNSLFKATWAMAYSEADGDENKARARYIRMRADQLDQEYQIAEAAAKKKLEIDTQAFNEELYVSSEPYRLASELLNELKSSKVYNYEKAQALIVALGGVPCLKQSFLQYIWKGGIITKLNDAEKHFLDFSDFSEWVYKEIAPKVIAERENITQE